MKTLARRRSARGGSPMSRPQKPEKPTKTIDAVLDEFLDEQQARLSRATFAKYETVVNLLRRYCESYWPDHDGESEKITKAGGTYCGTYGAEEIPNAFHMFQNYFMPHKVIGSEATFKAAGTVIRKLAKWLARKGYAPDALDAVD